MRAVALVASTVALALSFSAGAQALTIGDLPTSNPGGCSIGTTAWLAQFAATTASYSVPAGGGAITSWSSAFGAAGAPTGLLVVRDTSGKLSVVGSDEETLPTPIAADHISTFSPANPILVQPGDTLGIYYPEGSGAACVFTGASSDEISAGNLTAFPPPDATLTPVITEGGYLLDVSAEVQPVNGSLGQSISPTTIPNGGLALVRLTPGFSPSVAVPSTVTDTFPSGLQAVATAAAPGSCAIAGQTVTCHLNAESATPSAVIVVSATAPGVYTNAASLDISPLADPNPADNSASASLTVSAPASTTPATAASTCHPLSLAGIKLSLAQTIFKALNCAIGKVTHRSSKKIAKGLLISNSPSSGSLPAASKINLVVSSGKPKKTKGKHRPRNKHG